MPGRAPFDHAAYMPDHWKAWLRAFRPESQGKLFVADFEEHGNVLRLAFEDGSFAVFEEAFGVRDDETGELAVFTEHCGYLVFEQAGLEWRGSVLNAADAARRSPK